MRMKHLSRENEIAAKDLGERSDNLYDSVDIEVSKKDNVAFRAKLFLTLVKKGHFEYDENGN